MKNRYAVRHQGEILEQVETKRTYTHAIVVINETGLGRIHGAHVASYAGSADLARERVRALANLPTWYEAPTADLGIIVIPVEQVA